MDELMQKYQAALDHARRVARMTPGGGDEIYNQLKEQIDAHFSQAKTDLLGARNQEDRQMVLNRLNELQDPSSQYYRGVNQQIRDNLTSVYNPNSLLALAKGSGLSGQGAATVANQQRKALTSRINETANRGTNQAYLTAGSMIGGLLGLAQSGTGQQGQFNQAQDQLNLAYSELSEQRRQFEASQPNFFEQVAGYAVGQGIGSLIGMPGGGGQGGGLSYGGNSGYGYNQRPWTLGQNPYYGSGG